MCWPGLTEMDVTDSGTKLRLSECSAQTPKVVFLRALLNQKHTRILKKFKKVVLSRVLVLLQGTETIFA